MSGGRPALVLILLLHAALVLPTLDAGLPYSWPPDEALDFASQMVDARTLRPPVLRTPTLSLYPLTAVVAVTHALHPGQPLAFRLAAQRALTDPAHPARAAQWFAFRAARLLSLLYSLGLIALAFAHLRRTSGATAGTVGAAAIALTLGLVNAGHVAALDPLLCLLVFWALVRLHAVTETGSRQAYLLAGAAIGLTVATKYTALALLVPAGVAHVLWFRGRFLTGEALRHAAAGGAALLAAFAVATPYALLAPGTLLAELRGGGLAGSSWSAYVAQAAAQMGWPLLLASAGAGLAAAAFGAPAARRIAWLHGSWIVALWVPLGASGYWQAHYLLPALPSLSVCLGVWSGGPGRWPRVAAALVLSHALAFCLAGVWLIRHDTRYEAGRWLETRLTEGIPVESVAWESNAPYLAAAGVQYEQSAGFFDELWRSPDAEMAPRLDGRAFVTARSSSEPVWPGEYTAGQQRFLAALEVARAQGQLDAIEFAPPARRWLNPIPEQVAPVITVYYPPGSVAALPARTR